MTYLQIQGADVGTINLTDNINYQLLEGWAPRVARRRVSLLGGQSIYAKVVETIPIRVFGQTETAAFQALENLAQALEQVDKWDDEEAGITAVKLVYLPDGSTLSNPLSAVITNNSSGDLLELPVTFNRDIRAFEINPVNLVIERRGEWLENGTESQTGTTIGDTGTAPVFTTPSLATFSNDAKHPSPVDLSYDFSVTGSVTYDFPTNNDHILIVTDTDGKMLIFNANQMTATNFANTADAGTNAKNGTVLRYTPPDTAEYESGKQLINNLSSDYRHFAVFVSLRNNSSTVSFNVRARIITAEDGSSNTMSAVETRIQTIDTSTQNPRWHALGIVATRQAVKKITLLCKAESTSGSPTLDVDQIVVMSVDDRATSRIIGVNLGSDVILASSSVTDPTLEFESQVLSEKRPLLTLQHSGTDDVLIGYAGNLFIESDGTELAAYLMATSGGTSWQLEDDTSTVRSPRISVVRRIGYPVVPE